MSLIGNTQPVKQPLARTGVAVGAIGHARRESPRGKFRPRKATAAV
jgi:hypothetical protein